MTDIEQPLQDDGTTQIDPLLNPELANQVTQKVLEDDLPSVKPPESTVSLLIGLERNGEFVKDATIRELNGVDEEYLAKFNFLTEPIKYLDGLLERGIDDIGGIKPNKLDVRSLTIGDRELLALRIRIASFGKTLEMRLTCPQCDASNDVIYDLIDDIPIRESKFETPENKFTLANGKEITIRFPTGADQHAVLGEKGKKQSLAEMNTGMIACCANISVELSRKMSVKDRREILSFITENQPGPQFGEGVKLPCANCREEFTIRLDLADLFPI